MSKEPDGPAASAPLILTLELDPAAFAHFETLRRLHFPTHRNQIPAHLTLFHKLPGEEEQQITAMLNAICAQQIAIELAVDGMMLLGRGVAFRMNAGALEQLRGRLAAVWQASLTPQDRQNFRPHVVVKNKVEPAEARALYAEMSAGFRPFSVTATGLHLWRYLGGPWESAGLFPFLAV